MCEQGRSALKLPQLAFADARVRTNALVRDMDLGGPVHDSRRLEILVEGLPLYGGVQLAIDTTLVSTLHCDGSARRGAGQIDGAVFAEARRRKEGTGRWSDET